MNISILICTYNGSKKLKETLSYISNLTIPDKVMSVELVIVDNNSTDNTSAFAKETWEGLTSKISIRVINESKGGKANALTTGYNASNGDLIVLCDDDNWLEKNYLVNVISLFETNPEIGMAGGYGSSAIFEENKPEWFDKFQFYFVVGKHHPNSGFLKNNDYSINGAGSVIRKKVWNKIYNAGFRFVNSTTAGKAITEDIELSMAVCLAGYKLYFDERLTYIHDLRWGRIDIDSLFLQEEMNGKGNVILYTYSTIYNLHQNNKLTLLRFSIHYAKMIVIFSNELRKMNANNNEHDNLEFRLAFTKKKSFLKHFVLHFTSILLKFQKISGWIKTVSDGK
ncbi:glycosyltransferase family 2 protein [Flavobacterium koreense]